ncbi:uncharacterized protein B0H18DRAFT_1005536 [Fomitopsis serialis]|uniref:uncharacterized protein n=1 Tax=Fomitopsis serialis TaxID=139415 RepID=UPI002008A31E|nr:uncharacterized protein B0H18DRAFT_1005536 [Neoantrodia serialis]KAH9926781.1 hypothetical protein B0H18DRAFT_1005536 [Neoantrodia serialis]
MLLRDIFSRLRRVQSLDLNAVDIDASLPSQFADLDAELLPFSDLFPFPELRELRLSSVIFNSRNDIMRLLAVFPRLCRLTASELLWQGRGTNGTPLGPAERESVPRMLINLKALWISTSMRRSWSGQRIKRSFATADWATYVADYRRLVLQLLHDTAPTVEQLCITTADSLAEVDSRLYTCVRDVKLLFRNLDSRSHLPFSAAAPTFLSRLASRDLTVLTLCFQVSMTWTNTNWSLVDWPAIDDVLVRLHRQNTDFKVIFRITCVVGNQPTLLGRCASSADVAKGLTDFLPSATGTHVRVGVSAYSMTGPVFYISPSGELLDEHSI